MKKIYSISLADHNRLEPYIDISAKEEKFTRSYEAKSETKTKNYIKSITIDLNKADTSELKRLRGIGSVLASRIVKFRDALGGFHDVDQVREVYGISQETFESIKSSLQTSSSDIKKIAINSLSMAELSKHPYISKKQAQAIINYRTQHGNYLDIYTLSQNKALDQDFLRKIEPYLEF